ncbi:ABC-2 type transport system ATP-binding protein [Butyrivibrio sp. INlla18]|uniref:ATP-binding cassette domain-containing protein n=1 Tax=Butyrivibrio sp. INlla18 TaxID=1520806 RepID=UPI00088B872A|nr:ABC transporter ATP-binding protein [Butyrivibrio sp. INlla18]SDA72573.1 ABC-2 type transport system ATP-binding protein [Butyrivibrio sp. INlla18]
MNTNAVVSCMNIEKRYKNFELKVDSLDFPKGFATALIGENGAGKTTLLELIAGLRLEHEGDISYFDKYTESDRETDPTVKNSIGYTGTSNYFVPNWSLKQVKEAQDMLFDDFDGNKYDQILNELAISDPSKDKNKKVSSLSDGNKIKLMLAGVFARKTDLLLMDEPASPLDPLMRDKLCSMIREYLEEGEGEKSVIFSTHNIADMENVTDYAVIVENGSIVEQGFVEELKEKYTYVKGDKADEEAAKPFFYDMTSSSFGFEGLCLSENLDKLAGLDLITETPTLSQLAVGIMRANTKLTAIK